MQICCAVQSVTSGACGEFSSVAIRSVQCVELRMTLITDSVSVTEGQNTPGVIQINFAMHPYLLCVSRFGSACRVAIQTSVAGRVRPNRRCPGGYSVPELVVTSQGIDCGRVIESTTIESFNVTVEVQATIDGVIDSLKRPGVQISCVTYSETITTPQINHVLGNVQVSVANGDRRATCASTGDPHIRTFDGFGYNSFVQGEFVFYQHKTLPYAVHAQHARCSSRSSATCTCRVAVKSGDDVILFTGCQSRRRGRGRGRGRGRRTWYMSIDLYMNGDLTEGTRIMRMGSTSKYEVVLPTGTVVTVLLIRGGFMNLWVTASSVDYQQSEGLCGFYDSRRSNDLVGGGRNPRRFRARSRAQNTFSNTWKILGAASIYTGVQIDTTLISGQPFADCRSNVERRLGHGLPVVRCTRPSGTDVTTTIVRSARHPISTQSRSKRQTDIEPIDLDEPLDESNFTIPMNESKAFCQELVDNSTVADKCKAILNETDYSEQVQNCADDYAITGDKEWGASHISDILEQCTSAIHTSEDLMNDTNADLVEAIQADSCIEACGRNGTCHDSVCICDAGFSGDTCSISKETTPDVDDLPRDNDPCDIDTGAPCRGIIITGSDFVESDNLTCHIKYVNVGASIELTGYDTSSKADFLSENLVQCVLPKEQSAYIYISNDGESLSNTSFLHVIYNKRCQECQYHPATSEADDASASCIDRDVCVINDICYAPNELNSEDSCQECDPKQSRTAWTQRTTPECTKEPIGDPGDQGGLSRDEKIVMAVVIPVAAVALIVGVSYACYRKMKSAHKKKKQSQMYHKAEHQYETTQVHDGYDNIGFKTGSGSS